MSGHGHRRVERTFDVAVVGGSAAGLAAALQLGRQRRSVAVIDAGEPRKAAAGHMHGFLGRDGTDPAELLQAGREEVRSYGGEVMSGRVVSTGRGADGRFRLELAGGSVVNARRVVVATGITDLLPDIDGVAEQWGGGVIHCPFCHGYEARDRRIVQIVTHGSGVHPSSLWRQLTDRLTIVLAGVDDADPVVLQALSAGGVEIVSDAIARVVSDDSGQVIGVALADGTELPADVVAVSAGFAANIEPFAALGLAAVPHTSGVGSVVEVDAMGETGVRGVYAAGNVTDPSLQVIGAAAAGSRVGAMVAFSLAADDLAAGARPSTGAVDWDARYAGERMWSANPNGSLLVELGDVAPTGTALDVGAGEGADAIWLAERGWQVTANDISSAALARLSAEAERRGLTVDLLRADANDIDAFEGRTFDLVSAFYASIPRTPDGRGVRALLDAVAPGGILLVVSHDLEPMRRPIDTRTESQAHDPDAYVRVEDVAAAIVPSPQWHVEVHEKRPRPAGAASTHHVDDVVLRARRVDLSDS